METAFIDNYADNKLLVNHEDDFARAIACGITDYVALQPDVIDFPVDKEFCNIKINPVSYWYRDFFIVCKDEKSS